MSEKNPSLGEIFRQEARASLVKNQKLKPPSPIVPATALSVVLLAATIAIYLLWQSAWCLVPLGLILVLMWVRNTMVRSFWRDFAALEAARTAWQADPKQEYLDFIAELSVRIVSENKALTPAARASIESFATFASNPESDNNIES